MKTIQPLPGENLLALGRRCDAVYVCPKQEGVWKGPLVPYAGKGKDGKNLVGRIYFNFRRIEVHPKATLAYAETVCEKLHEQNLIETFDTVCGIPQGGRSFGQMVALVAGKKYSYADKKAKPTSVGQKQEYEWDLSQFEFEEGERVAFAEDVFNNLQNTDNTLTAIAETGADVVLLIGALNRSPIYKVAYRPEKGPFAQRELPIVASISEPYPQYEQSDPEVAADIAAGNIEWEVKKNWARLMAISA